MNKTKTIGLWLTVSFVACLPITVFSVTLTIPYKILIMPKYYFNNTYYSVAISSFVTSFKVHGQDLCAFYRIFTCEENLFGKWEIEKFDNSSVSVFGDVILVKSSSHLYSQNINKTFFLFKDRPYFYCIITKQYLFNCTDCNNQIIFDCNNDFWNCSNLDFTPIKSSDWFSFTLDNCTVKFTVLGNSPYAMFQLPSNPPNTEFQIDFLGQRDRTMMNHTRGEINNILFNVSVEI
jgi:hypothetical protein